MVELLFAQVIVASVDVNVPVPEPPVADDGVQPSSDGDGDPDELPLRVMHSTLTGLTALGPWPRWPLATAGPANVRTRPVAASPDMIVSGANLRIPHPRWMVGPPERDCRTLAVTVFGETTCVIVTLTCPSRPGPTPARSMCQRYARTVAWPREVAIRIRGGTASHCRTWRRSGLPGGTALAGGPDASQARLGLVQSTSSELRGPSQFTVQRVESECLQPSAY